MTGDTGPLAHELPYWGWVDERTCLTRAGELVTIGALTPVVVDGRTAEDLDAVCGRWQRMLSGLPPEMRVSWIVERRPVTFDLGPAPSDIAGLAQRKRQAFLGSRVQDIDAYVVWSFDPRLRQSTEARGRGWWRTYLAEWLRRRRAPHESVYLVTELARAVKTEAALVAASAARVADVTPIEILTHDEAAAVLYRLVNGGIGGWVPGMRTDAGANWRLAGEDVAAERQVLHVGGEQFGVWSCVAPPAAVTANALEELYALPAPMTVVLEWQAWSREAARRKMRSAQRHYFSRRYSMAAHMQEKEGTTAALEDAAASVEAARAGAALVELETEGVGYGDVALSVAVRGSAEQLEQCGANIQRVFGSLDAKAARESYGQLAVWFGRLPGQPRSRQPRRVFVSAGVSACLAPLFGPPRGDRRCAHLDAPALTRLRDAGRHALPLRPVRGPGRGPHADARGHGRRQELHAQLPSGPGAAVHPAGSDPRPRGSYRALTQFLGGGYLEVSPEKDAIPLRPFGLERPSGRCSSSRLDPAPAADWRLGGVERRFVGGAGADRGPLCAGAGAPVARELARSLPAPMWPALSRWHGSGAWGKWFDNPPAEDADLTLADWQVIDLAGAVEHEDWCEAALLYLLERLRTEIESPAETTRLKLMVVDEAWRYLRDPVVLGRLTEAARTWRKRNAALILATQSVGDITETAGAAALLEAMPTRLFLANPDFPAAGQATFQLNDDELRIIRELEPKRELYLRRPTTAAVLPPRGRSGELLALYVVGGRSAATRRDGGALRGGGRDRAPGRGTGSPPGGGARLTRGEER